MKKRYEELLAKKKRTEDEWLEFMVYLVATPLWLALDGKGNVLVEDGSIFAFTEKNLCIDYLESLPKEEVDPPNNEYQLRIRKRTRMISYEEYFQLSKDMNVHGYIDFDYTKQCLVVRPELEIVDVVRVKNKMKLRYIPIIIGQMIRDSILRRKMEKQTDI
ncbi:MAG: hypothetical protein IJ719_06215 [Clostridia bacterium]|nr:hypothetical protein [Clostridia bacterium]